MKSAAEKTKILFILHMPPPVHGAAMVGQYIHDSQLINAEFDCRYINFTTAQSLEDVGKGGVKKLKTFLNLIKSIKKEIRAFNPDWIYITPNSAGKPFYKDFVIVQFCKYISKAGIILHFHNKGVKSKEKKFFDNLLYKRFFKNTKVILIAKPLQEDIQKYVSPQDCYICHNGIPQIHHIQPKRENKIPHILWLTNIMRTKGLMEFVDALKILKDRGITFQADFIGGITQEITKDEFQQKLNENGLGDCTIYHGEKYGNEKDSFLQQADIFVLPSYTEAFPLSILEAMQYSIPVVTNNVGGICDAIENGSNGILLGGNKPVIEYNLQADSKELADAIETLISNPDMRKTMGETAHKKYIESFTLESFYSKFHNVLQTIVNDI